MKSKLYILLSLCLLAVACTNKKQKQADDIIKLEESFYKLNKPDQISGNQLIRAYAEFADQFPDDSLSPVYLFKAADLAMNLEFSELAIQYFDRVQNGYPKYEKAPECLFLKAFIYENKLHSLELAEKNYRLFIDQYPDHALAKDAQAALKYLGMSAEDLVKLFQEQGSN